MKGRITRRADLCLVAGILLLSLLLWLGFRLLSPVGRVAIVTCDGMEVICLPLDRDAEQIVTTTYGTHTIRIRNGKVSVTEAPCPDLICVHHAPISQVGESIVCLPCHLVVQVSDERTVLVPDGVQLTGKEREREP